jgi:hypothetical protein
MAPFAFGTSIRLPLEPVPLELFDIVWYLHFYFWSEENQFFRSACHFKKRTDGLEKLISFADGTVIMGKEERNMLESSGLDAGKFWLFFEFDMV